MISPRKDGAKLLACILFLPYVVLFFLIFQDRVWATVGYCVILDMKRFKTVTTLILTAVAVFFVANIYFLSGMYGSIKEHYITMAKECLAQADIIEIVSRLRNAVPEENPDMSTSVDIDLSRRMTESGRGIPAYVRLDKPLTDSISGEKLLGLFQSFNVSLAHGIHKNADRYGGDSNLKVLDSLFMQELNRSGLYPKRVIVIPADSVSPKETKGMWEIEYSLMKNSPVIYKGYMSPPLSDMLHQTIGVVTTTALVIIVLVFGFYYLVKTVVRMRNLEEMKDDFVNNMTHELKTPIAVAYSANDTLLNYGENKDPEKRKRYLEIALAQLTHLSELVETILSMSMERRKTLVLSKEKIRIKPFLSEIVTAHTLNAIKKIEINMVVEPDDLEIETDSTHFANVINNLIDNAIKYSGENVDIEIFVNGDGISVSDNGNGIPARCLPYVFNKFYRVPTGNRQDVRGYGIGLYYVKNIIMKMGWDIKAESEAGKGSIFTIRFLRNER